MTCLWCVGNIDFISALKGKKYCSEEHHQLDDHRRSQVGIQRLLEAVVREGRSLKEQRQNVAESTLKEETAYAEGLGVQDIRSMI
jgi:hypothetical protein